MGSLGRFTISAPFEGLKWTRKRNGIIASHQAKAHMVVSLVPPKLSPGARAPQSVLTDLRDLVRPVPAKTLSRVPT